MQPKYATLKFSSIKAFEKWLGQTTKKVITLQDKGQDLQSIYIDSEGEIIHTDFQSKMYIGRFIELASLKIGEPLQISVNESYVPYNGLVVSEIQNKIGL